MCLLLPCGRMPLSSLEADCANRIIGILSTRVTSSIRTKDIYAYEVLTSATILRASVLALLYGMPGTEFGFLIITSCAMPSKQARNNIISDRVRCLARVTSGEHCSVDEGSGNKIALPWPR